MVESRETLARWLMSIGIVIFVGIIIYASMSRETFADNQNKTLAEFKKLTQAQRHSIVNDYMSLQHIDKKKANDFYACVSEKAFTKDPNTHLNYVVKSCKRAYDNNLLSKYVSFDGFANGFDSSSGSYLELDSIVKNTIQDSRSYHPIETTYRFITYGTNTPKAIVNTLFSEVNSSGRLVRHDVTAAVDVATGKVLKVISVL
ncbi:hypothetical protein M9194_16860 [Vibrio sp. S4M6]|uniref:hypothetical protein n=1 Tax=Vibrio sinus TaxID=2946865 RepID=UPI00202A0D47|nr:hypothetical protein [Vibrio sinus]MCL9783101.1 hypothetical protein [Vibrio sinus]